MLLQSITLENFRQYKGLQTINFSTDKNENVTVILGQNTNGKTTLVQSFIWCLYGKTEFKDKEILNAEVKDDIISGRLNGANAGIRIKLTHDDKNYLIERKENYSVGSPKKLVGSQSFKIYEGDSAGNYFPIDNTKDEYSIIIKGIMPENLAEYFFFWGERIEKLSEKKSLSEAVQQIIGLDTINNAIKHLSTAIKRMTNEGVSGSSDEIIEGYRRQEKLIEKQREQILLQIESQEKNRDYNDEMAKKYFAELTTSENKDLQKKQNEFKEKTNRLNQATKDLGAAKDKFNKYLNDPANYIYYYSNDLATKAVQILKDNPEPIIGWNYIDLNAINEILERGKCICGREFEKDDDVYKHLIGQRNVVAPNVVGGVINSFIEAHERRPTFNERYYDLIHDEYRKISELNDEIVDLQYDVDALNKAITNKTDLQLVSKRYNDAQAKSREAHAALGRLNQELNQKDAEATRIQNNIQSQMAKNKKYLKQARQIEFAKQVLDSFNKDYENGKSELKERLVLYVNQNFDEVYSGERRIVIDDSYNAVAVNKVGERWIKSETSPGLETVKNFAFITGLVKCAKDKIFTDYENKDQTNTNVYPLVLDAPFSQADENHVPAISKLISDNAEQIILVVMEKDWNYAKDILDDKVGRFYRLEKLTETNTKVREEK